MNMTIGMRMAIAGLCSVWAGVVSAAAPAGWFDKCFGSDTAGSTASQENGGQLDITITGAGIDIWAASDTGRFVFMPMAGDCEIIATIPAIPSGALYSEWARQGLMMRGATLNNAEHISFLRNKGPAATGMRLERSVRASYNAGTASWGGSQTTPYGADMPARLRFVRQGDTYSAWASTNAPAYDMWEFFGSHTVVLHQAMNVGLVVSRHGQQVGGPDTLTCAFENVIARNLVTAAPDNGDIAVAWIGDTPVTNGTVTGYAVRRASGSGGAFEALGTTAANTLAYTDTTAEIGISYVYRVYVQVDTEAGSYELLVGTSLPSRRPVVTANPSPAAIKGVYAEYVHGSSLNVLATRVDPNINNSWNYSGMDVYPPDTTNGLTELRNFRTLYAGNITAPETGCYGLANVADDMFELWVDGIRLTSQGNWLSGLEFSVVPVWLEAGKSYPIRVEHRESDSDGGERAILRWAYGSATTELIPQSAFEPFPWPWQHRDIGESPLFGNAIFDPAAQSFTVASGGLGIDSATGRDDSHFMWRETSEDFDLIARVADLQGPAQPGFGAGLMMRSSGADNAAVFSVSIKASGATGTDRVIGVMCRAANGAMLAADELPLPAGEPMELRLSRQGANLWAYYRTTASDGWVDVAEVAAQFPAALRAGMTVFSGDTAVTATGVFDQVTFAYPNRVFSATAANGQATLTASSIPPMEARQYTNGLPNVAYYWADQLSGNVDTYTVYRSNRQDGDFEAIGAATRANGFTYIDSPITPNTLVFYRLEGVYDLGVMAGGEPSDHPFLTGAFGVSDGSVTGTGTGLFASFHRGVSSGYFYTNRPIHSMIRDLSSWEKGTANTPIITGANSDDGAQIGPDNFQVTWAGWLIPQYTGYHVFRTQADDVNMLWVNGKRLIAQASYAAAERDSAPVWLEAGQRVPIHIYFQQGTGGGYFRMWWKHGLGFDAGFVTIPATQLVSVIPDGTPVMVGPGTGNTFGPWRNIDIGAVGCPGHAALGGTPEAFDCTITGSGTDAWGNADSMHFVYREVAENFEIEATFNSILLESDGWAKTGLMVRESDAPGARNVFLLTSVANAYRIQNRNTTDGVSNSSDVSVKPADVMGAATPVTFKLVRKQGKIIMYVDDTRVTFNNSGTDQDISDWAKMCVGIAFTSHSNGRNNAAFVSDVTFTVNHSKGTVMLLK